MNPDTQLSLFNTATAEVGNSYQVGDWVKVRRKPAIAAWVKRGEIFQVDAVHPTDGSMRFWNPHINQWDFLYPDEVKLTVESVVGEVSESTVESVVGEVSESTVESVVGEVSEPTVESVVGEVSEPTIESVVEEVSELTIESVVGEVSKLTIKSIKNYYWNSDKGYSGNGWLENHYKIRRNGKQHSINCPEIGCTGPYSSYRWMEGKRQRGKYVVASKCPAVEKAIKSGKPISEILQILSDQ
jgi:hypothetical protein